MATIWYRRMCKTNSLFYGFSLDASFSCVCSYFSWETVIILQTGYRHFCDFMSVNCKSTFGWELVSAVVLHFARAQQKTNFRQWTHITVHLWWFNPSSQGSISHSWPLWAFMFHKHVSVPLCLQPSCTGQTAAFARGPAICILASWRVLSEERSYLTLTRTSYEPPEGPHTPLLCKVCRAVVGEHMGLFIISSLLSAVSTNFNTIHNHNCYFNY